MSKQKTTQMSLEEKLGYLTKDRSKVDLIEKAVEKGETVSSKLIDFVFTHYEKGMHCLCSDDMKYAITFAKMIGDQKRVDTYLSQIDLEKRSFTIEELVEEHIISIDNVEKLSPKLTAKIAEKMEDYATAIRCYEKEENYSACANLSGKLGEFEKSIEYYVKANNYGEAASIAFEIGKKELAKELYSEAKIKNNTWVGDMYYLGTLAKKLGFLEDALEFYEESDHEHDAAKIAEKLGKTEKALELMTKLAKKQNAYSNDAADLAEKLGKYEQAVDLLLISKHSSDIEEALELTEKYNLNELKIKVAKQGLENSEQSGWYKYAAKYADMLGQTQRADVLRELAEK